jgi:hypothetical protein
MVTYAHLAWVTFYFTCMYLKQKKLLYLATFLGLDSCSTLVILSAGRLFIRLIGGSSPDMHDIADHEQPSYIWNVKAFSARSVH